MHTAAQRFVALDLLRFLAVVLMVQGHTFREVLDVAIREQRWHGIHNYIHGYTAPIFLFSSGLAFGITTFRSWDKHLGFGPTLFKRLERYVLIILIGYALHIPRFSLTRLFALPYERLGPALVVDALQNIGFTLLLAELSVVALRSQKRFVALIAAAMVALVLAAPALWRLDLPDLHPLFTGYVNSSTGSIFPIAPWAAFLLAGILTAYALWDPVRRSVRPNAHYALLGVGLATILLGKVLSSAGIDHVFGEHNYWKTSPYFFVVRIGVVWLVLALLMIGAKVFARAKSASRGGLVQTLGQETLVIYVAHLFVLYGSPFSPGVVPLVGKTLSVVESSLLFGAVFCAMIAIAIVWHEVKTRFPVTFNHTRRLITAALVLLFLFSS
ncbi:MAG: DUF1624 domain-containing protein [Polyangiaceae bacterium]|nr:DUF1624 domain-containing protein [Polyangiaceae bacterium]